MKIEESILALAWITALFSTLLISKKKAREASFIFLMAQFPSWFFGLLVVEFGLLKYPYREFSKSNTTSFTFEFLVLPILNIFFNIRYPKSNNKMKVLKHYIIYGGIVTILEVILEKYTNLIEYVKWHWTFTLITLMLFFYLLRIIYLWYFKIGKKNN